MRLEDINRILKGVNQLHKMKLYVRETTGNNAVIWVYFNYKRKSLGLPSLKITNQSAKPEETAFLRKAIERRNELELQGDNYVMFTVDRKEKISKIMQEWAEHYMVESSVRNAKSAKKRFLAANGDIPIGELSRRHIVHMMDKMKQADYNLNYVRGVAARFRTFCNYAEQRGYMNHVNTHRLLPPERFGEVKVLNKEELALLAATPCMACPDVKDLFMLGVYTVQRIGEVKLYTFSVLYDGQIKVRQGKTGKFIVIPLSEAALEIMKDLKRRRESEGKHTEANDKMFCLPSSTKIYKCFHAWLEAAGISKDRITLHNSRSTAISLLINKGVPESVTQELANHSDPRITARYYRQIDDSRKREALEKISFGLAV
ncbi:MAG: tyrosine-type recombinase/integrase [Fibromonadaceae bacterium]|jgi:integrase|nr:tyrosine-type recombinase/integrase [Fibromonadaceae bacterium]